MALAEDLTPLGDLSGDLIDDGIQVVANIVVRQEGVLAGTDSVNETFFQIDPCIEIEWFFSDSDHFSTSDRLASVSGDLKPILAAERVALNFLSHLSGIATNVAKWVEVADGRVKVWDTRKTLPGYRSLQKASVVSGGGYNHRGNLSDWIMIKDNHLKGVSISQAVKNVRENLPGRVVEVEVEDAAQAEEALISGADIIMFDNFEPSALTSLINDLVILINQKSLKKPLFEASGGISLESLDNYANTGVDMISSGSLTNHVKPIDIGLDID